jgi:hypothetical protein
MFARELCVWARLDHENVLSLVGIVTIDDLPALASEWMENGTMNEYLKTHTDVNVLELVRETIHILNELNSLTLELRFEASQADWSIFTSKVSFTLI